MILSLPPELHIQLLTFLRAKDLSVLQQTCRAFNDPDLIHAIIDNFANHIYPPELCEGFDTPAIAGDVGSINLNNYEPLRNMEMLVVARILSRPEPSLSLVTNHRNVNVNANAKAAGYYYVSKAWCRDTLKYLNAQTENRRKREEQREQQRLADLEAAAIAEAKAAAAASGKKMKYVHRQKFKAKAGGAGAGASMNKKMKKKSKRKERMQSKGIEIIPPAIDVNNDITCVHNCLKPCGSERASRAKRRLMDKQAWKVIKKLYPGGVQLNMVDGECIQCIMEAEMEKKNEESMKVRAMEERKKPLSCPLVRAFYNRRTTGVPKHCLVSYHEEEARKVGSPIPVAKKTPLLRNGAICPLVPGVYNVLPRAWCHRWRKYIKTGEGGRPPAPDASGILCDGHQLPLIPPHLELYLQGATSALLDIAAPLRSSHDVTPGASAMNTSSAFAYTSTPTSPSSIGNEGNLNRAVSSPTPTTLPVGFAPVSHQLGGRSRSATGAASSSSSSNSTTPHTNTLPRSNSALSLTSITSSLGQHEIHSLRAATIGISEAELQLQRFAMMQIEEQRNREIQLEQRRIQQQQQQAADRYANVHGLHANANSNGSAGAGHVPDDTLMMSPEEVRSRVNAQLDRENKIVVEILTDEEMEALERWWPGIHSCYALKFAVVESPERCRTDIVWTTDPCRDCDASGRCRDLDFVARNRSRNWINNTPKKRYK